MVANIAYAGITDVRTAKANDKPNGYTKHKYEAEYHRHKRR
jgi:hypothetical protein